MILTTPLVRGQSLTFRNANEGVVESWKMGQMQAHCEASASVKTCSDSCTRCQGMPSPTPVQLAEATALIRLWSHDTHLAAIDKPAIVTRVVLFDLFHGYIAAGYTAVQPCTPASLMIHQQITGHNYPRQSIQPVGNQVT